MNIYSDSIPYSQKQQNEDLWLSVRTQQHGHLLMVLDFAAHKVTNAELKFKSEIGQLITSLDKVPGLTDELFLGYVGKDINNYVYEQGQKFSGGHLSCVAAICLLRQNRLIYLTYGDARINVYTDSKLILLNGAKYLTPTVIENVEENPLTFNDNPESFGRRYLDSPLTERIRSMTVKDSDVILIFSDGLEEATSPQRRLSELHRVNSADPKSIWEALMQASNAAQDDRTLIVITGPYDKFVDPVVGNISQAVSNLREQVNGISEKQGTFNESIKTINTQLGTTDHSIKQLQSQLTEKADSSAVGQEITKKIDDLKTLVLDPIVNKKNKGTAQARAGAGQSEGNHLTDKSFGPLLAQWIADNQEEWRRLVASPNTVAPTPTVGQSDKMVRPAATEVNYQQGGGQLGPDLQKDRMPSIISSMAQPGVVEGPSRSVFFLWLSIALIIGIILGAVVPKLWSGSPSDVWIVRAEQSRFILIHQTEGRTEGSLPIQLSRPPGSVAQERQFQSFGEAQAYIGKYVGEAEAAKTPVDGNPSVDTVSMVTVQSGDNIEKLAQRYNTTADKLRDLNRYVDWSKLRTGTQIAVPIPNGGQQ